MMELKKIEELLQVAVKNSEEYLGKGEVANYIPELVNVDHNNFGIALTTIGGDTITAGDDEIKFSIQSISKVFDLIMAIEDAGEEKVFSKIDTEATEYPFNTLIPIADKVVNPFINAGAIATTSLIAGEDNDEKFSRIIEKLNELSNSEDIDYISAVYESEMATTDRNRAISFYLKALGILEGTPEEVLKLYIKNCAIGMNVAQLSRAAAVLANGGLSLDGKTQLVDRDTVAKILSLMATSGMYEESGKYLLEVGLPSKSGVGGGIMAIAPGKCGICTYSPRLDQSGNSLRGKKTIEELSKTLNLNIFL